nr:hypothetical protein B0A51_01459 [Rachicladosporium sp. CCFEE 5018]
MSPLGVAVRKGIPLKNPKGTIRAERETLRASTLQLLTDNDTLRASKVDMTATTKGLSEDKDALRIALSNATTENKDLRALIEALNGNVKDLETSIETSNRALEVEKADADKLKASNNNLSKANKDLEARVQRAGPAETSDAASFPSLANDTMNHPAAYIKVLNLVTDEIGKYTRALREEHARTRGLKLCLEGIAADDAFLISSADNNSRDFAVATHDKIVLCEQLAKLRRAFDQAKSESVVLEREVALRVQERMKRAPQQASKASESTTEEVDMED